MQELNRDNIIFVILYICLQLPLIAFTNLIYLFTDFNMFIVLFYLNWLTVLVQIFLWNVFLVVLFFIIYAMKHDIKKLILQEINKNDSE